MTQGCQWCPACRRGYPSHCTSPTCTHCPDCGHGVCINSPKRLDKANHGPRRTES